MFVGSQLAVRIFPAFGDIKSELFELLEGFNPFPDFDGKLTDLYNKITPLPNIFDKFNPNWMQCDSSATPHELTSCLWDQLGLDAPPNILENLDQLKDALDAIMSIDSDIPFLL